MPKPAFNNMHQLAEARSHVYQLLASVYNLLPNADFVKMVLNQDVRSLFSSAVGDYLASNIQQEELEQGIKALELFQKQVDKVNQEELITRLGVDRTRLFRGLKRGYGPPPPYECVYLGGDTVMGEAAMQVKEMYSDSGYNTKLNGNEPPDYVGIELDFLRFLCHKESEAWQADDQSKAWDYRKKECEFLCNHIVEWVPRFCKEVLSHARENFYQGIARLTGGFVLIETERLKSMVTEGR
jgi:TorA maturation chaperone TorD